jgi:hypothetical protein
MALDLGLLLADYNGAVFAQVGALEWGYIPNIWKLAIPDIINQFEEAQLPDNPTPNVSLAAVVAAQERIFIKAQFHRLRGTIGDDEGTLWVAMMRLHAMKRGVMCKAAGRRVNENEYSQQLHAGADWDDAANNLPVIPSAGDIARWVKRFGNCVLHAVGLAFLSRGHHYKKEYDEYYDRLMAAQGVDMRPGWALPSKEIIFRLSVHCFGVRPLIDLITTDKTAGRMSAAMMLRLSPAPAIAGCAHITTLQATLTEMKKEPWWNAFNTKFQGNINEINTEVQRIQANPLNYHVATRFITGGAKTDVTPAAKGAFDRLCVFAMGYIDYLGKKHALSGQKAITHHAGGGGGMVDIFSKACQVYGKGTYNEDTMAEWLANV